MNIPATPLARRLAKEMGAPLEGLQPTGEHGEIRARDVHPAEARGLRATPAARRLAKEMGVPLKELQPTGEHGEIRARDVHAPEKRRIRATPMARRLAEELGVDISRLGDGRARIRRADVAAAAAQRAPRRRVERFSGAKRITGRRMLESHLTVPPVTLNAKADVTELLEERRRINASGGVKISINDMVIEAVAAAIRATPAANASYTEEGVEYHDKVDIGVAVSMDRGLIVPVLRSADTLSLEEISLKMKDLAARARSGKLDQSEYTGGTFTISNLGMYGITSFTPIINLPESMILGVCAVEKVLTMTDGKIENRDIMGLSLTFDHRVHDGAQAAEFLKRIITNLQERGAGK